MTDGQKNQGIETILGPETEERSTDPTRKQKAQRKKGSQP